MNRLSAGLGAGLAVCLVLTSLGLAALGQVHYAVTAAVAACVAALGYRIARLAERLDALESPRCDWCGSRRHHPACPDRRRRPRSLADGLD